MPGGIQRPSDTFDVHHVLRTTVTEDGVVMLNIGDARSEVAADERVPLFQTPGVLSLPANPSPGTGGAEVMCLETSAGYIGMSVRDNRKSAIAGQTQPGETTVFASGSQACTLYKANGSVTQFTTHDNTANGRSVYSMVAPTGFTRFMPWGKETFDEKGFHVTHISGARIDLGAISGLPPPLDTLDSYASMSAKIIRIEGSTISLGTSAGVPEPIAKATTLLALLTSLQAEHTAMLNLATAIAATPAAVGTAPAVNPAVIAAFTALNSAMASTAALLSAATLALPSAAVSVS